MSIFLFCGVIGVNRDNLDSSDQAVSVWIRDFHALALGAAAATQPKIGANVKLRRVEIFFWTWSLLTQEGETCKASDKSFMQQLLVVNEATSTLPTVCRCKILANFSSSPMLTGQIGSSCWLAKISLWNIRQKHDKPLMSAIFMSKRLRHTSFVQQLLLHMGFKLLVLPPKYIHRWTLRTPAWGWANLQSSQFQHHWSWKSSFVGIVCSGSLQISACCASQRPLRSRRLHGSDRPAWKINRSPGLGTLRSKCWCLCHMKSVQLSVAAVGLSPCFVKLPATGIGVISQSPTWSS